MNGRKGGSRNQNRVGDDTQKTMVASGSMTIAKRHRTSKRQLGQFITPPSVVDEIVERIELTADTRVLEPSFGDGAFILPLLRRLVEQHSGSPAERLSKALTYNVHGVELDGRLYRRCLQRIEEEFGELPPDHNLVQGDFFRHEFSGDWRWAAAGLDDRQTFDLIIGNPPFGGTFDADDRRRTRHALRRTSWMQDQEGDLRLLHRQVR